MSAATPGARDPYRGVLRILIGTAALGTSMATAGGILLRHTILFDTAVMLGLSSLVLLGVHVSRARHVDGPVHADSLDAAPEPAAEPPPPARVRQPQDLLRRVQSSLHITTPVRRVRFTAGLAGLLSVGILAGTRLLVPALDPLTVAAAGACCAIGVGLAGAAARYFASLEPAAFPEAGGLARGARVVAWVLALAALSMPIAWAAQDWLLGVLHIVIVGLAASICYEILSAPSNVEPDDDSFPVDFLVVGALGRGMNPVASLLETAQQHLGIDLRSTWALAVVRRGLEPLVLALALLGWLTTALTVVALEEQGLVERFGVSPEGAPLPPGLHLHWPWPIERVVRIPVRRVQAIAIGHEAEGDAAADSGPEDVLWARQHEDNEYTLLLGDGRDLITVDAAVQYRITDARAWHYGSQNPADALRAIAYRAVMRATVSRTLSEALSENVVTLAAGIRERVQSDADTLGLGVDVVAFTVGAMHPPVAVAADYQAVVSSELAKVTAIVNAQAFRNQVIPAAEAAVLVERHTAEAEAAGAAARAVGEAWAFRTAQAQYRAAPADYLFRQRLEALERSLTGRRFMVVDTRIQRDGGELWLTR